MPQPLKYGGHGHFPRIRVFANGMLSRPQLASHIVVITQMWTNVDHDLGFLLAVMTGAEAQSAIIIYNALVSNQVKADALKAVARYRLNSEHLKELESLLSKYRKISVERNNIVHGRWGISDEIQDAIFLIDTRWQLRSATTLVTIDLNKKDKDFVGDFEVMIYKESDFIDTESRISNLNDNISKFIQTVEQALR
jgi:hypothetical protein